MFSKKATKIDQIFIVDLTLTTRCQIDGEGFINFCGLLRKHELQKTFCYQTLFWPFTFRINCSSYLKIFANSRPSASNFKSFSQSLEHFFLTVGQKNFGNKIPFLSSCFPILEFLETNKNFYTASVFQAYLKVKAKCRQ